MGSNNVKLGLCEQAHDVSLLFVGPMRTTPRPIRWTQRRYAHVYPSVYGMYRISVDSGRDTQWVNWETMARLLLKGGDPPCVVARTTEESMTAHCNARRVLGHSESVSVERWTTYLDILMPWVDIRPNNCVRVARSVALSYMPNANLTAKTPAGLLKELEGRGWRIGAQP